MLICFILLGKFLEARASSQTSRKLTSLMTLAPEQAVLVAVAWPRPVQLSRRR